MKVRQNPVSGCCATLGRHRNRHPPARPPHNIEMPTDSNGRPSSLPAKTRTKRLTATPTQGPAIKPAAHAATIRSLNHPVCETLISSTNPRTRNTSNAVPRSRIDSRERSGRLKPGTRVSTNAAVTNTQMSLQIVSIAKTPESIIEKDSGGTTELCKNQLHHFTERSMFKNELSPNLQLIKLKRGRSGLIATVRVPFLLLLPIQ